MLVDLAYPDVHGVVIEYDAWDFHRPRTVFEPRSCARQPSVELLGLTVLRFTSRVE